MLCYMQLSGKHRDQILVSKKRFDARERVRKYGEQADPGGVASSGATEPGPQILHFPIRLSHTMLATGDRCINNIRGFEVSHPFGSSMAKVLQRETI